jgi:hypothetical protein
MFTQAQAIALRERIRREAPGLDVQVRPEEPPYIYNYYIVISQDGKPCFIVRSERQWQERKRLLILA